MEKKEYSTPDHWVDDRMAELEPRGEWRPNAFRALAGVRDRERKASARRRAWGWGAAATTTVCVVVLAVPAMRAAAFRACTAACAAVWPSLLAEEAESLTAEGTSPRAASAPDFALTDAAGNEIRLSDLKGKVVLLNFWATWCGPCKIEMPWFVDFQRKYEDRGFAVVAVSLDEEGWPAVRPFVDDLNPNFPVVIGDDALVQRFGGISVLPTTLLIDREGAIRARHEGLVSASDYEEGIQGLLSGRAN